MIDNFIHCSSIPPLKPPLGLVKELCLCDSVPQKVTEWLANFYVINHDSQWLLQWKNHHPQIENKITGLKLAIDFSTDEYKQRQKPKSKEILLDAIKIKKKLPNHVIDTTPGLLKDSLIFSSKGVTVTAIERNPLLFAMVNEALKTSALNINYIFGDSITLLKDRAKTADIIYLDPMFPPKKKSAKVKQAMQVLQDVVGKDIDASQLMEVAISCNKRVVVKRPANEEPITTQLPSHSLLSAKKMIRYDVYI